LGDGRRLDHDEDPGIVDAIDELSWITQSEGDELRMDTEPPLEQRRSLSAALVEVRHYEVDGKGPRGEVSDRRELPL